MEIAEPSRGGFLFPEGGEMQTLMAAYGVPTDPAADIAWRMRVRAMPDGFYGLARELKNGIPEGEKARIVVEFLERGIRVDFAGFSANLFRFTAEALLKRQKSLTGEGESRDREQEMLNREIIDLLGLPHLPKSLKVRLFGGLRMCPALAPKQVLGTSPKKANRRKRLIGEAVMAADFVCYNPFVWVAADPAIDWELRRQARSLQALCPGVASLFLNLECFGSA